MWRKFLYSQQEQSSFILDLITIHYDPQNFFTLFDIAMSPNLSLLCCPTSKLKEHKMIKLRLILRALYLSQAAILNNKSFFGTRYQRLHDQVSHEYDSMLRDDFVSQGDADQARIIERSNSSLFDLYRLPNQVVLDLLDSDCSADCESFKDLTKSFSTNYLSVQKPE